MVSYHGIVQLQKIFYIPAYFDVVTINFHSTRHFYTISICLILLFVSNKARILYQLAFTKILLFQKPRNNGNSRAHEPASEKRAETHQEEHWQRERTLDDPHRHVYPADHHQQLRGTAAGLLPASRGEGQEEDR